MDLRTALAVMLAEARQEVLPNRDRHRIVWWKGDTGWASFCKTCASVRGNWYGGRDSR
jgi:hypothetical protein